MKEGGFSLGKHRWSKEEIAEYRKKSGAFFYFNKDDSNIFVSKASGLGSTLNWANPVSWLIVAAVVIIIYASRYIR